MDSFVISIAKDFSRFPVGRYYKDGPWPGQKFREELLVPALNRCDVVTVDLDGTMGLGSSFLEEAFAGLVRVHKFKKSDLKKKLKFTGSIEAYKTRIWQYISEAD